MQRVAIRLTSVCPDNVEPRATSGVFVVPADLILSETEV